MNKSNERSAVVTRIGLDLAKNVFQAHGVDAKGDIVVVRKIRRRELLRFAAKLAPCEIAMEACSSAHHWARELSALGHSVKLIPPAHVKPYVRRKQERRGRCGSNLRGGHAAGTAVHAGALS